MIGLILALASAAPLADFCYDRAIVGRIVSVDHFTGLDALVGGGPADSRPGQTMLYFGGRWDAVVKVEATLAGEPAPETLRGRVILTDLYSPRTRLLMLLKKGPVTTSRQNQTILWRGRYSPAANADYPWRILYVASWRDQPWRDAEDLPPRC